MMLGRVAGSHLAEVERLVELAAVEGDGKGLERRGGVLARVMENSGRIEAATEPYSDGNVSCEVLLHRCNQEMVQALGGFPQRRGLRGIGKVGLPVAV